MDGIEKNIKYLCDLYALCLDCEQHYFDFDCEHWCCAVPQCIYTSEDNKTKLV